MQPRGAPRVRPPVPKCPLARVQDVGTLPGGRQLPVMSFVLGRRVAGTLPATVVRHFPPPGCSRARLERGLGGTRGELRFAPHAPWRFAPRPGSSLAPVAARRLPEPINPGEQPGCGGGEVWGRWLWWGQPGRHGASRGLSRAGVAPGRWPWRSGGHLLDSDPGKAGASPGRWPWQSGGHLLDGDPGKLGASPGRWPWQSGGHLLDGDPGEAGASPGPAGVTWPRASPLGLCGPAGWGGLPGIPSARRVGQRRGAPWVPVAPSWRLSMLAGAGTASVCAGVSSIPGARPGSRVCLVTRGRRRPVQPRRTGELGRPRLGPHVLGTTHAWDHAWDLLQQRVRWLLPTAGARHRAPSRPVAEPVGAAESRRLPGAGLGRLWNAVPGRWPECRLSPPACTPQPPCRRWRTRAEVRGRD